MGTQQADFAGMCGASPRMQKIYDMVAKLARTRELVLIRGESGTGKELVARALHAQGPWSDRPFVPINCGAMTATLVESEMFGHVRGAFTGATENRQGLLAAAGEGTVFLDEIGELPLELQVKLLRVLQEREIRPLGSNQCIPFRARIIAATNRDLQAALKNGTFREDLYFRLNVVPVTLPPLRERREDIPGLIRFFFAKHKRSQTTTTDVSDEAMARLMGYDWPGNVRELENCIQRVLALGGAAEARVIDLPSTILYFVGKPAPEQPAFTTLRELEKRQILQALEATQGDRQRAAKLLGIGKTTIYRKIKEYGLDDAVNSKADD